METSRQNVWAVLKGEKADYIPKGEVLITEDIIKAFPNPNLEEILSQLDADLVTLPIGENAAENTWREWAAKPYFVFGSLDGPFLATGNKMEWSNLLRLMRKDKAEAQSIMKKEMEVSVKNALHALDQGCEAIIVAEAIGSNGGLLFSSAYLEENYLPLLEQMLKPFEQQNIPVIFHSVGQILQLIPFLKELGFWGVQGLQPSVGISPQSFLPKAGHWTYWGNFEFEDYSRLKTPDDVSREVSLLLDSWAEFPGYIFGSYGGLYKGLSPEAITAAYQSVNDWNKKNQKPKPGEGSAANG